MNAMTAPLSILTFFVLLGSLTAAPDTAGVEAFEGHLRFNLTKDEQPPIVRVFVEDGEIRRIWMFSPRFPARYEEFRFERLSVVGHSELSPYTGLPTKSLELAPGQPDAGQRRLFAARANVLLRHFLQKGGYRRLEAWASIPNPEP